MEVQNNTSPRYSLNKHDGNKIGRAALYSCLSALVGFTIALIPQLDVPPQYAATMAALVPVINITLVTVKKWLDDHGQL